MSVGIDKRFKEAKTEKVCKRCQITKPITAFYQNRAKNRSSYCKICGAIRNREWEARNPERKIARRRAYDNSPVGKLSSKLCFNRYVKRHPERRQAKDIAAYARKKRQLERKPCELCGALLTDGHHADYSKPLSVTWLCRKHHIELHAKQNRKRKKYQIPGAEVML